MRQSNRCSRIPLAIAAALLPVGAAAGAAPPLVRVKAAVAQAEDYAPDIVLAGTIAARIQSNVAFRAGGKVTARLVEVGQHVRAGDVLATLDTRERQADVDNALAALTAAQAQLQQAEQNFSRQKSLLDSGFATRANFDQAKETLTTGQAQLRSSQAALNTAREQQSYTSLTPGQDGIVVARNIEAGQVVQAGQTAFVLAQDGPRDAVFNVPEALLTAPPADKTADIALQADPRVTAAGTVREISPILDAATSTVMVKVGLSTTPPAMTLGAAVVGRAHWREQRVVKLPWSALMEDAQGRPAVWELDAADTVSLQPVDIQAYGTGTVLIRGGLPADRRVVTAGGQLLYPGQTVAVTAGDVP